MNNLWSILRFGMVSRRALAVAAVVGCAIGLAAVRPWDTVRPDWWNWFEPVFTLTTLFGTILIWYQQTSQQWEDSLPKVVDVIFSFEGKPVMECRNATLISEGDIRAMAQQIGSQLNGNSPLSLHPVVLLETPRIATSPSGPRKHYGVNMRLRELPEGWKGGTTTWIVLEGQLCRKDMPNNSPEVCQ